MERVVSIEQANLMFGNNFIGPQQINQFLSEMNLSYQYDIPCIEYQIADLEKCTNDYILILGVGRVQNIPLSISTLRNHFGTNPEKKTPCFYNQDWYLKEDFIHHTLENKWYLIKKNVFEDTRTILPNDIVANKQISFPTAIMCVYTFFAYYFAYGEKLWYHDFVWCNDFDHNGDRIYVGKYNDIDGVNKDGFSIHRHLSLRPCYGAISIE